ncbi:MAG: inner-rane translocator [Chloroflexi bacterium]|nr:inner-rane translocator [Chloroflexota bacterium]MDB5077606.1 inner-rane translocator [Chloroflexota bacterium]
MAESPLSAAPVTEPSVVSDSGRKGLSGGVVSRVDLALRLGLLGIIIVVGIYFAIRTIPSGNLSDIGQSTFISTGNLQNIARQMAVVGVLAVGETFVIITAGIDLSIGAVLGFSGIIAAQRFIAGWPTPAVIVTVLLLGIGIGLVNGFLVGGAKVPPFIVTLGMLGIARGAAYLAGNGLNTSLSPTGEPVPFSNWASDTSLLGIPNIFLVLAAVGIAGELFLRYTRRGRYVYALGSNPEAARLSGVNVLAIIVLVYAISGCLASMAGLLQTGRLNGANPNNGLGNELDAIAAVVLGGASLFGARGNIIGTFFGLVLINELANGIDLIGADAHVQQAVEGLLLIVIVWVDQWRKRRIASA